MEHIIFVSGRATTDWHQNHLFYENTQQGADASPNPNEYYNTASNLNAKGRLERIDITTVIKKSHFDIPNVINSTQKR